MSNNERPNPPSKEQFISQKERIVTLEATVEHMDAICHTRETRIATLESRVKELEEQLAASHLTCKRISENDDARVKAADGALFLAIKNKEKAEDDERLGRTRIAALEALGKELDQLEVERITSIATLKAQVKDLGAELSGWQQNYADQMSDPKQREAYLSQLKKRKERG